MYAIKANTPEETQAEIARWLSKMASNHRIALAKMTGFQNRAMKNAVVQAYEEAAQYVAHSMHIERKA